MRRIRILLAVAVTAALFVEAAAAQGVSVLVPSQQAEQLPDPIVPPATSPEVIPTPAPTVLPAPWVWEPQTYAVPVVRWGILGKRLVPQTIYVRRYTLRPAQVVGPYYIVR